MNAAEIRTHAVFLGPYRNLTTLTASILALHPRCQVLNHAGSRILARDDLDFFRDPSTATMERFVAFALEESRGGRRGDHGGSITLSHAFERGPIAEAYADRYGDVAVKERVDSLVWKDSLRVSKHLRESGCDVRRLLDALPGLRFLLPVRNPLDCTASNCRTGHAAHLEFVGDPKDPGQVLTAVLGELAWFRSWERERPDRFRSFFANAPGAEVVAALSRFLDLEPDDRWTRDAVRCFDVRPGGEPGDALRRAYDRECRERFASDPGVPGRPAIDRGRRAVSEEDPVYQFDEAMADDSGFEPGELGHVVAGNAGRLLDPRRTPVTVRELRLATGTFVVRIEGFEDRGAAVGGSAGERGPLPVRAGLDARAGGGRPRDAGGRRPARPAAVDPGRPGGPGAHRGARAPRRGSGAGVARRAVALLREGRRPPGSGVPPRVAAPPGGRFPLLRDA